MNESDGQDNRDVGEHAPMTEYFCKKCLQLRLSLCSDKSKCFNCGSKEIIPGQVGELNKQALLKHYGYEAT